ncbi:MAG: hypothetical protein QNJ44_16385 [Rhodobacter sp.]|nr:hypothetical protein [Rhodobacter sp.]
MTRAILLAAVTTGAFCAIFAVMVDAATDALSIWQVAVAGLVSGFLGSLFASLVLRRRD